VRRDHSRSANFLARAGRQNISDRTRFRKFAHCRSSTGRTGRPSVAVDKLLYIARARTGGDGALLPEGRAPRRDISSAAATAGFSIRRWRKLDLATATVRVACAHDTITIRINKRNEPINC